MTIRGKRNGQRNAMVLYRSSALATALLAAAATLTSPTDAPAQDTPLGVIELFTSQGCNSCPPADEIFAEYARGNDVVALAYHVDYWDYLGWNDTFALKENAGRQNEYMRVFGNRSVYTPQAVINGRTHVGGASRTAIADTLTNLAQDGRGMVVPVTVTRTADVVVVEAGSATRPAPAKAHIVLVFFDAPSPVVIDRGENRGKTVTYWNAVSDIQIAGMWQGKPVRLELPASEIAKKGGSAVLIQESDKEGRPGPIIGAAVVQRASTP